MGCLQISASLCSLISLGLLLAALATDYWVTGSFHMGLWNFCKWDHKCIELGMVVNGYIHATRAFMLAAVVPGAVSLFGLWFSYCCPRIGSLSLVRMAAIASFIAGICAMLAMAIFTGVYSETYEQKLRTWYEWSFGLGWASGPLYLLTGALAYKVQSKTMIRGPEKDSATFRFTSVI